MTAPESSAPLGFGIVGLGMIADYHARAIAAVPGARLVGVATRDPAKAQAFAARHGGAFATTDVEALVQRPDLDVVCITTPAGAHLEPALIAARAGKHLLIEKPLEITTERIDRILAAADAAGVRVGAIFQGRFGEGARTVHAALAAGRFGRLVLASAAVKWHRTPQYYAGSRGTQAMDGGGAVMNQAIHAVDLLQWYAGLPDEVQAWTTRRVHQGIETEDTAVAALRWREGLLGTIEATTATWPGWQRRIELCGEHGSVVLEDDHIARWDFRDAQPQDEAIRTARDEAALASGASAPNAIQVAGHQRQIEALVRALRAGQAPEPDGREGRRAVAVVEALYRSAAEGRVIRL